MSFGMGMNQLLEITILKGGMLWSGSSRLSRRLACLFISASAPTFVEWNFGGIPVWLKYVLGISFRTDNELFKNAMQGFIDKIVDMMKSEKLFASQGGPIILSQASAKFCVSCHVYGCNHIV